MPEHTFYRDRGKRIFDLICAGAAVIVLSPVLLILFVLVRIMHGSPVIFSPTRPGKDEKIFHLYKFRTMSNAKDENGILLPEKDRVTGLGKIMRAASLDELPELFNILKGDMSVIGPRPLAKNTLPAYPDRFRKRFAVRPGLSGLAQINGRNALDWNSRYEYDLEYVDKVSFGYDVKLILGTLMKVFKKGEVTIPGTNDLLSYNAYRRLETEGTVLPVGENGRRPEIGGGFSLPRVRKEGAKTDPMLWLPKVSDQVFSISGRCAIELAIADLASGRKVKKALVPSYCSFGMLQPFIERGIRYEFYEVTWNGEYFEYKIDTEKRPDVVLISAWFGTGRDYTDEWIRRLHKRGIAVIEDVTHTLLGKRPGSETADYYTASLRKWFALPSGGWLGKTRGKLSIRPFLSGDEKTQQVTKAMREKEDYLTGKTDDKRSCLIEAEGFETWLVLSDCMTKMDSLSVKLLEQQDTGGIIIKRKENARRLMSRLDQTKGLTFMITRESIEDNCPLAVPVLVGANLRNELAEALSEAGIFCHVHWAERMGASEGIRGRELSLVCDQRYGPEDMDRMADVIRGFFAEHPVSRYS